MATWLTNVQLENGNNLDTGKTAGNVVKIRAYDTDGVSYTDFVTLTANTVPTMVLASAVTGTTQTANDNSTKLATTAYVDATGNIGGTIADNQVAYGNGTDAIQGNAGFTYDDTFVSITGGLGLNAATATALIPLNVTLATDGTESVQFASMIIDAPTATTSRMHGGGNGGVLQLTTGTASAHADLILYGRNHATSPGFVLLGNGSASNDVAPGSMSLLATNAWTSATTVAKVTGANLIIRAGAGADGVTNLLDGPGGSVTIDGGVGANAGADGDVLLSSNRGNVIVGGTATANITLDQPDATVAGQYNSGELIFNAKSYDTSNHDLQWKTYVDPIQDAGTSSYYVLAANVDGGGWVDKLRISTSDGDMYLVSANAVLSFSGYGASIQGSGGNALVFRGATFDWRVNGGSPTAVWNATDFIFKEDDATTVLMQLEKDRTAGSGVFFPQTPTGGTTENILVYGTGGELKTITQASLTGNEVITLSGDVGGSGATAITTTIGANKVTLGMMSTILTDSFLGRITAATGNVEVLTNANAKTMLDLTGTNSGDNAVNTLYSGLVSDTGEPATLRSGGTPTLNTGVTAAEMRTLIGAGTITGTSTNNYVAVWNGVSSLDGDSGFQWTGSQLSVNGTILSENLIAATVSDALTNTSAIVMAALHNSSGVVANGFGTNFQFKAETTTTVDILLGEIDYKWTTAAHATRTSEIILRGVNSGVLTDYVTFNPLGGMTLGDVGFSTNAYTLDILSSQATAHIQLVPKGATGGVRIYSSTLDAANLYLGTNSVSGTSRLIEAAGSGANIDITLKTKGTGHIAVNAGYETGVTADDLVTSQWVQDQGYGSGTGDMLLGTIQTVTAAKTFNNGTLLLDDSATAFDLILRSTSAITTANKSLTFNVNNADRTLTISANATISGTNTGDNAGLTATAGTISGITLTDNGTTATLGGQIVAATTTVRGGIELEDGATQTTAANTVTTTAARTYGLQINAAGQGVINVPWTSGGSGTILGSIAATAGVIGYGTGVADTLTSSTSLVYDGTKLDISKAAATGVTELLRLTKTNTGVGANTDGSSVTFYGEDSASNVQLQTSITSRWDSALSGFERSELGLSWSLGSGTVREYVYFGGIQAGMYYGWSGATSNDPFYLRPTTEHGQLILYGGYSGAVGQGNHIGPISTITDTGTNFNAISMSADYSAQTTTKTGTLLKVNLTQSGRTSTGVLNVFDYQIDTVSKFRLADDGELFGNSNLGGGAGGTTNFLREDGTWVAPAGGATSLAGLSDVTSATQTAGFFLSSNGAGYFGHAIVAGDIPTLNQNTTGTAAIATKVTTTAPGTNATFYPTFSNALTGNNTISTDSNLTYNPSTNMLTTGQLTVNGQTVMDRNGENLIVRGTANGTSNIAYIRFKDNSNTNQAYIGMGSAANDYFNLYNYIGSNMSFSTNSALSMHIVGGVTNRYDLVIGSSYTISACKFWFDVSAGAFHADGNITAYSTSVSDIRLKKNVESISSKVALELVLSLDSKTFNNKFKHTDVLHSGYIAHEFENYLPHLVSKSHTLASDDSEEYYKTINYTEVIPYVTEAMKEQQAQIEELKMQIQELFKLIK